jgi:hypothetical protein
LTTEPPAAVRWLRTRPSDLVAETLSDETLVIDTATGVFFSLRGVASALWSMLEGIASDAELRAAVRDQFADSPSIDTDLDAFLVALEADSLVVETPTAREGDVAVPAAWPDAYAAPEVKKYDDMADLLLVDPIHDVAADRGWPDKRADSR